MKIGDSSLRKKSRYSLIMNNTNTAVHMNAVQLAMFYPEHREALTTWLIDHDGDEGDSFSVDPDGVLCVEPSVPQTFLALAPCDPTMGPGR